MKPVASAAKGFGLDILEAVGNPARQFQILEA